jgi:hypothetical protein
MKKTTDNLPSLTAPPKRQSHLPAWLLATSDAVEASALARNQVELRIKGVQDDSRALGESILDAVMVGAHKRNVLPPLSTGPLLPEIEDQPSIVLPSFGLHRLPEDMVCLVSAYFDSACDLARFSMASTATRDFMASDSAGYSTFEKRHHLFEWDRIPGTRAALCVLLKRRSI